MKRLTEYIERDKSLITGKENLEHLYTFKDFPVFMGCVETPQEDDVVADMVWNICKDTGLIQLGKLLPLEILYLNQHNDGVGEIWQDHYKTFAKFLEKFKPKQILEIGGAHDYIANNLWDLNKDVEWATVEPNPQYIDNPKIKVLQAWFDDKFKLEIPVDTVIHSHVLEHTYNPFEFLENISKFLKKGDKHIFTFPNMLSMLENKFTNCINFEHTILLTEEIVDCILLKTGFKIIKKEYFGTPHSIFYATEKIDVPNIISPIPNNYEPYKEVFMDYINYHINIVKGLNIIIEESKEPVYIFGAHIFSQALIQFGLKTGKIVGLLDNSLSKNKKRLYGTSLIVESPKILKGKGKVKVILKAGIYNEEIKKDILENINSEVEFY
ncbi:MAG: methyltransferase domain-containing protein [Minisyncoccia bacterium]